MNQTQKWKFIALVMLFTVTTLLYIDKSGKDCSANNVLHSATNEHEFDQRRRDVYTSHQDPSDVIKKTPDVIYEMDDEHQFIQRRKDAVPSDVIYEKTDEHQFDQRREDTSHRVPSDIIKMAPDIFRKVPRQFLPQYKSPCWFDKGGELYCLPYFYVIGVAKCGTTDLWDKITQHPDVVASVPKEPHWWARRRLGDTATPIHVKEVLRIREMTGDEDDSSINWYLNWLKTFGVESVQASPTQKADGALYYPKVFGDASISTSSSWGKDERNYTNADLIHAVQPQAKIIMIVRDPTQGFFSQFNYNSRHKGEGVDMFDDIVRRQVHCFTKCRENYSEQYCTFIKYCGMSKSIYVAIAEDWMRVYGRGGIHILRLEDWHSDTAGELKKVLKFLELPSLPDDDILRITTTEAKNVNVKKTKRPAMWNSTQQVLQDFFRPFNKRFADLMNDKRFLYE